MNYSLPSFNAKAGTKAGEAGKVAAPPVPPARVGAPLVWVTVGVVLLLTAALVADRLFRPDAFRFETISLRGKVQYLDTQALLTDLKNTLGGNYFSVDLHKIDAVVHSYPWVKDYSLRRKWPKTLQLWVEEHRPVARWAGEPNRWLTATGEVVALDIKAADLAALPRISGEAEQAPMIWQTWQRWSQPLNRVGLALAALDFSPSQIWTARVVSLVDTRSAALGVDRGIYADQSLDFQLKLLAENADQQLNDFLRTVHGHFQTQLADIEHVDLRYHHGFAVKWRKGTPNNWMTDSLSLKCPIAALGSNCNRTTIATTSRLALEHFSSQSASSPINRGTQTETLSAKPL